MGFGLRAPPLVPGAWMTYLNMDTTGFKRNLFSFMLPFYWKCTSYVRKATLAPHIDSALQSVHRASPGGTGCGRDMPRKKLRVECPGRVELSLGLVWGWRALAVGPAEHKLFKRRSEMNMLAPTCQHGQHAAPVIRYDSCARPTGVTRQASTARPRFPVQGKPTLVCLKHIGANMFKPTSCWCKEEVLVQGKRGILADFKELCGTRKIFL